MLGEITLLFIGAVIGWATSVYGSRVSEKSNLIGDHIKDLMNYSEKLWQHWCASYVEDQKSQAEEIAKIRTMYISINSFYEHHAQELFDQEMIIIYNGLIQDLVIATTGEDFEHIGREINEQRAFETQEISWKLIQILRKERWKQYRLDAPFRILIRKIARLYRKK